MVACPADVKRWSISASYPQVNTRASGILVGSKSAGQNTFLVGGAGLGLKFEVRLVQKRRPSFVRLPLSGGELGPAFVAALALPTESEDALRGSTSVPFGALGAVCSGST